MRKITTFFFLLIASFALYGQTSCIEGKVLDTAGSPIPGIGIIGVNSSADFSIETATDIEGHFSLDVPPGRYRFVTSDEHPTDRLALRLAAGNMHELTVDVADAGICSRVTLRRPVRARLYFHVTDLLSGTAVPQTQAQFRIDPTVWKGGLDDKQALQVPPGTELEVQVFSTGYQDSEVLKTGPLQPGEQRTLDVALRPLQTGCLTGTVVDDQGAPVANVSLQPVFAGEHRSTSYGGSQTDKEGHFRFDTLQPGRWSIFTNASGYLPPMIRSGYANTEVEPGAGCVDVTVPLGPKPARLEITVLDAATGKSIRNPEIWAMGDNNGNGGWSLRLMDKSTLAPALTQFIISATAHGYQAAHVTVSPLSPESLQKITIVMDRKASRSPQGND